ncbi:MAG TPA: chromate transporter [Petrotogaceae bacterium]|jgi:chromate transporter|nr:chromate transporter [Petrotogaceae bacterium]HQC39557.1 chromate transporter [Petrotogaceae bacterium]
MIFNLFWMFLKVSALTLGGGYAMVPVMDKQLQSRGIMIEKDFYEILTIAQSLPGPIAFNVALLCGKKVAGIKGAFASTLGVLIPPFFAIVLAASIIKKYSDNVYVKGFLKGSYGAVIGMVGGVLYKMASKQEWNLFKVIMCIAGVLILLANKDIVVMVFLLVIILNYVYESKKGSRNDA